MSSAKAIKTRSELLEAARAVIVELGIERLSMDRVAERAGMSKGAVMYHFKTKRALLAALVEDYAEHLEAKLREGEALFSGTPEETFFPGYIEWFRGYEKTIDRLRSMPKDRQPMAFLCVMALEGLFYSHKFGLDPLRPDEKRIVFETIRRNFPAPPAARAKRSASQEAAG